MMIHYEKRTTEESLSVMYYGHSLHWVALHHILFGQLQQHRVVEELVDTDILTQTLQQRTTSMVIHQDNNHII